MPVIKHRDDEWRAGETLRNHATTTNDTRPAEHIHRSLRVLKALSGRFMRVRVFDCWMHEHDIRDAVSAPGGADAYRGPDTRMALDEMTSSMGFVVAKKGGAPDGSRVELTLTGPLSRTIRVAVDGRAALVADFGGEEPTTAITLDGRQFVRLAGGRPMIADAPQTIDYDGDAAVGARIVENLAYVI
jgi:hypothetical protein